MSYSPENSEDPLFTKKSRRCDDFPVVFGDSFPSLLTLPSSVPLRHLCCDSEDVNLPKNPSSSSYKDKVTDSHDMGTEDLYPLDDDDIDLLEEDVCFGEVDGIPSINFSDRIQQLALKSLDLTLVVKVLGRRVGYNTLHNHIFSIWKPSHSLKLIDIDNNYFLVKFVAHCDYLKSIPSRIMAWVHLPITCYKHSLLEAIGSRIGFVVKIDFHSDNGSHGKFARMAVKINLHNPLISKLVINGRVQLVYESLLVVCFGCDTYGHTQDLCPKFVPLASAETHSDSPVPPTDLCVDPPADPYGSWMIVERKPRRTNMQSNPNDAPHDPPLSDDLIRDSHSHITHAVDKAPFGARVENARITSKVTVPSRKSIGISLGSSSLSIPTSRMSRPGSSLTNRHPKSKNMGAFLNPKKNSAIRIEVDDNHVTTILKRPTPSSTSHLHRIKSWILFQLLTMSTIGLTWLIDHSTILLSFHDEFKHDSVESPRM
ncbi:hypothetical protein V6N11_071494 [Hibiscus sabdariffa]|uniref:DUF4283 domain-containing protein n=1 Tax=Hibiscus sabdariffa TaxID=183260 RepID=A0ABR2U0K9_9ROSI